jgi:hypothetical protein
MARQAQAQAIDRTDMIAIQPLKGAHVAAAGALQQRGIPLDPLSLCSTHPMQLDGVGTSGV